MSISSIRERLGPFDLVMLEVGAFHPSWGDMHLGPQNSLKAYTLLGGGTFLPVHWGMFSLAMHAWDQPAETLVRLAAEIGGAARHAAPGAADGAGARRKRRPLVARRRCAPGGPRREPAETGRLPDAMSWPLD